MNGFNKLKLAALLCSFLCIAWGGGGRGQDNKEWKRYGRRPAKPAVVIKMHRYSVPKPNIIRNQEHVIRDQKHVEWPQKDEAGNRIVKPAANFPPGHHTQIVRNTTLVRNITARQRVEIVPNRYYWHVDGGLRYCHYYDNFGFHWYGFYHGPTFYWCRFYGDRWWWYDRGFARWVYWWDGFWWWPGPAGVAYVYVDNNYYPYEEGGVVTVQKPEVQPPPAAVPSGSQGNTVLSPDGTRMVQVTADADGAEAFLYDKTGADPVFMKFLAKGVEKVRFSRGNAGGKSQLLLEFKDGSFAIYDTDGNSQDATAEAPTPTETPGPPPESVPEAPPAPSQADEMPGAPPSAQPQAISTQGQASPPAASPGK